MHVLFALLDQPSSGGEKRKKSATTLDDQALAHQDELGEPASVILRRGVRQLLLHLLHDRLGLALYAIVPIVFLSIFATVFGGFGRNGENKVRVALLDLDRSEASGRLVEAARKASRIIASYS